MKKIICLVLFVILTVAILCSCNEGIGIGSLTFRHLHYNTYWQCGCINIQKWYNNENGIEVKTTDGTAMFFSEGTYILVEDQSKCPFCN